MFLKIITVILILPAIIHCKMSQIEILKDRFITDLFNINAFAPNCTTDFQKLANDTKTLYIIIEAEALNMTAIEAEAVIIMGETKMIETKCNLTLEEVFKDWVPYFIAIMSMKPDAD